MKPLSARSISMDSTFNKTQSGAIHYLCPFKAVTYCIICAHVKREHLCPFKAEAYFIFAHLKGLYREMDSVSKNALSV